MMGNEPNFHCTGPLCAAGPSPCRCDCDACTEMRRAQRRARGEPGDRWLKRSEVLAAFDRVVGQVWADPSKSPADAIPQARRAIAELGAPVGREADDLRQRVDQLERDVTRVGDRMVALRDTVEAIVGRFQGAWNHAKREDTRSIHAAVSVLVEAPDKIRDKLKGAK